MGIHEKLRTFSGQVGGSRDKYQRQKGIERVREGFAVVDGYYERLTFGSTPAAAIFFMIENFVRQIELY